MNTIIEATFEWNIHNNNCKPIQYAYYKKTNKWPFKRVIHDDQTRVVYTNDYISFLEDKLGEEV